MTREEAIKVLDAELKERSAGYYDYLQHYGHKDKAEEAHLDSLQMAISALREQEEYEGLKNSYAQLQASFDQIYESNMAMGVVIKHLREQDKVVDSDQFETVTKCNDMDGCEYCRESENIYYHAGVVNVLDELLYITGDDLVVDIGCKFYLAASIKFCPMCGRRLEEV